MNLSNKRWLRAITALSCFAAGAFINNVSAQSFSWSEATAQYDDNQYSLDVASDDSGNVYSVGFYNSSDVGFDVAFTTPWVFTNAGAAGTEDGFLLKHDKAGTLQWAVPVGGTGNDRCSGVSAFHYGNENDNIYVTGVFSGTVTLTSKNGSTTTLTSTGGQDAYVAKYNLDGNLIWAYDIGGTSADYAYHVSANGDGTNNHYFYVVGKSTSGYSGGTGLVFHYGNGSSTLAATGTATSAGDDGYLVKYIDNGTTATASWARTMGSAGTDAFYCVSSNESRVVVGGLISGSNGSTATLQTNGAGGTATVTLSGSYDMAAASFSSNGNYNWFNRYGGSSVSSENATSIAIDESNNTYVGGYYGGGSPYSCSNGGWEALVLKVNSTGSTTWSSCGGSSGNDYIQGLCVDKCGKRVYATGTYVGSFAWGAASLSAFDSPADNDGFLLELDGSTGTYISGTANRFGGTGVDIPYSIRMDGLNHTYLTGISSSYDWNIFYNYFSPAGNYDAFLCRWNDGVWPATSSAGTAIHKGIDVNSCDLYAGGIMNGSVTFGGTTHSSTTNTIGNPTDDIYVTKTDRFGNYTMFVDAVYGNSNADLNDQTMDASNLYFAGYAGTGATGNAITFNTSPSPTTVTGTNGVTNAVVFQTDLNGTTTWYALGTCATGGQAYATGVSLDGAGYVYVCGYFQGNVTFGSTTLTTAAASTDAFIVKYSTAGVLQWAKDVANGTGITVKAMGIDVDGSGNICITGSYGGTASFIGSPNVTLTTSGNNNDIFVARYNSSGLAQVALSYTGSVNWDEGDDIIFINTQLVYITGYCDASAKKSFTAKCTMGTTPAWSWTKTASGSASYGTRLTTEGNHIYVTGQANNGTVFGSTTLSLPHACPFVVRYFASNGAEEIVTARDQNSVGYGIALDNVGVDNVFIAGETPAFIDQLSSDRGDYARHANDMIADQPAVSSTGNLFPNPSDGSMTLQIPGATSQDAPASLIIFDLSGRVVMRKDNIVSEQTPVDAKELANGVYAYEIVRNNTMIGNGKISIAR